MKKYYMILMALVSLCFTTACKDDDKDSSIATSFSALAANGSATETTTVLTLTFDKAIEGLTADDITLTAGETGTTKGALTAKDAAGVYELAVSGITKSGEVTVGVAKEGYTISPASKKVAVTFSAIAIPATFSTLAANGSDTETTTVLTLIFDQAIEGLTADDITLTAGETGTTKGALTAKEAAGVYELAVSGITKAGDVTVGVAKAGYTITPASKTVAVTFVATGIPATFNKLAANGSATETTTVLTLTFDKAIEGLTATDITLTSGETGATKGTLTAKGGGVYELVVSGVAKAGEVTLAVAKAGHTITPASQTVTVFYVTPVLITNKTLITAIEAAASVTFDKNADGDVDVKATGNKSKIESITVLDINSKSLTSLEGIEYFINLINLNCATNQLTTLDITPLVKLISLDCRDNQLPTLDVTPLVNLTNLDCSYNSLTAFDITNNTELTILKCEVNELTALDVTKNTQLTTLICNSNKLTVLDVTKNTALTVLNCRYNRLTALNVAQNIALTELYCYNNRMSTLDVSMLSKLVLNSKAQFGDQTTNGSTAQGITVTVTQAQENGMFRDWLNNRNNTGVTLNVKQ